MSDWSINSSFIKKFNIFGVSFSLLIKKSFTWLENPPIAIGGFSSQVNDFLINKLNDTPKILNFFMKDEFIDQSDIEDQYSKSGISSKMIYEKLINFLKWFGFMN